MKEYLLTPRFSLQNSRLSPAHLVYKTENGHLQSARISINLHGGLMVIGRVDGILNSALVAEIVTECMRREFEGLLIALPALPTDDSRAFATELSLAFSKRNLALHLPVTYSSCGNGSFLVPGICNSGSFSQYITDAVHDLGRVSVELSLTSFESDILTGALTPISRDKLKSMLACGAMPFYSASLCTNYFTHNDSFILFDTPETLKIKRDTAKNAGASTCFFFIAPDETDAIKKLSESY